MTQRSLPSQSVLAVAVTAASVGALSACGHGGSASPVATSISQSVAASSPSTSSTAKSTPQESLPDAAASTAGGTPSSTGTSGAAVTRPSGAATSSVPGQAASSGAAPSAGSSATTGPAPSESASAAPTGSGQASSNRTAAGQTRHPGVPAQAYPGAGGPIPADAKPATAVAQFLGGNSALIVASGGQVHCQITATYAGCGAPALIESQKMGVGQFGPVWWASVSANGRGQAQPKGDAPDYMNTSVTEQALPSGGVVRSGDFACAANAAGTTCWNGRSGHGFFINASIIKTF